MAQTEAERLKQDQNGPERLLDKIKHVLTGSNQTLTGPHRIKPLLTGSNLTHTGPDRLKALLTG